MTYVQQIHLVISQWESKSSQVIYIMSKSKESLNISVIPESKLLIPIRCIQQSCTNIVFKDVFESLTHDYSWKEFNFHVDNRLFPIVTSCSYFGWKKRVTESKGIMINIIKVITCM